MNGLKSLSDSQLMIAVERLAAEDRRISAEVVRHFYEIDRRRLYATKEYSSMFDFAVRHLGYSESCANRRINAARLLRDVPEVESAIREGKVSVASVSQAQTFFRAESKREQGKTYSANEKRQVIQDIGGLSKRAAERYFAKLSPEAVQPDRVRAVDETHSEVRYRADHALMAKLDRVREIWAHRIKTGSHNELLHLITDLVLEKSDPLKKAERAHAGSLKKAERAQVSSSPKMTESARKGESLKGARYVQMDESPKGVGPVQKGNSLAPGHASTRQSRYIVVAEQNFVQKRDQGACAFVSADGKRCWSRHGIQFDHYPVPFAMGGPSTRDNLRLVCRAHNTQNAIQVFGARHMERYLPGLRPQ